MSFNQKKKKNSKSEGKTLFQTDEEI